MPGHHHRGVGQFLVSPPLRTLLGSVLFTKCSQELEVAGRYPEAQPSALRAAGPIPSLQATAADDISLTWQVVRLTWWAVCRDSVYYTLSVIVLIAVSHPSHPSVGWSRPRKVTREVTVQQWNVLTHLSVFTLATSHLYPHCALPKDLILGPSQWD